MTPRGSPVRDVHILARRKRIFCARLAQALRLPELVGWLNERITR